MIDTAEIERLRRDLVAYKLATGKSAESVIDKQGRSFAFTARRLLRQATPPKGSLRAQGLALLESGRGVQVRPRIRARIGAKYRAATSIATKKIEIGRGKKRGATVTKGGKQMNLFELSVEAELAARERGRGFLGISTALPSAVPGTGPVSRALSKYGPTLSVATRRKVADGPILRFQWGLFSELSAGAAVGLARPRSEAAINRALAITSADIRKYLDRKNAANIAKRGLL